MTATFPDRHSCGSPYGKLDPNRCKEEISVAYTHAVVTAARCKLQRIDIDDFGVDAELMQTPPDDRMGTVRIDAQLKCTSQDVLKKDHLAFQLPKRNYDFLSATVRLAPAILVVMVVPSDIDQWVTQGEDALHVVKCAYWMSLYGMPEINEDSKVVRIPRGNLFDVESLLGMMEQASTGQKYIS